MPPLPPDHPRQGQKGSEAGTAQGSGSLRGNDDPEARTVTQITTQKFRCWFVKSVMSFFTIIIIIIPHTDNLLAELQFTRE